MVGKSFAGGAGDFLMKVKKIFIKHWFAFHSNLSYSFRKMCLKPHYLRNFPYMKQEKTMLFKSKKFLIGAIFAFVATGGILTFSNLGSEILLSQFSGTSITPLNASELWKSSTGNTYRSMLSVAYAERIDVVIVNILARGSSLNKENYIRYLADVNDGIAKLVSKPQYAGNKDILNIIGYVTYELKDIQDSLLSGNLLMGDFTDIVNNSLEKYQSGTGTNVSSTGTTNAGTITNTGTTNTWTTQLATDLNHIVWTFSLTNAGVCKIQLGQSNCEQSLAIHFTNVPPGTNLSIKWLNSPDILFTATAGSNGEIEIQNPRFGLTLGTKTIYPEFKLGGTAFARTDIAVNIAGACAEGLVGNSTGVCSRTSNPVTTNTDTSGLILPTTPFYMVVKSQSDGKKFLYFKIDKSFWYKGCMMFIGDQAGVTVIGGGGVSSGNGSTMWLWSNLKPDGTFEGSVFANANVDNDIGSYVNLYCQKTALWMNAQWQATQNVSSMERLIPAVKLSDLIDNPLTSMTISPIPGNAQTSTSTVPILPTTPFYMVVSPRVSDGKMFLNYKIDKSFGYKGCAMTIGDIGWFTIMANHKWVSTVSVSQIWLWNDLKPDGTFEGAMYVGNGESYVNLYCQKAALQTNAQWQLMMNIPSMERLIAAVKVSDITGNALTQMSISPIPVEPAPYIGADKVTANAGDTVTFNWEANGGTRCYTSVNRVKNTDLTGNSGSIPVTNLPAGKYAVDLTCTYNNVAKDSSVLNLDVKPSAVPTCATDPIGYYLAKNPDVKTYLDANPSENINNGGAEKHWNKFWYKEQRPSCWPVPTVTSEVTPPNCSVTLSSTNFSSTSNTILKLTLVSSGLAVDSTMSWTYSVPDGRPPLVRDIAYSDLNQTKVYEFPSNSFPPGVGYSVSDFIGKAPDGSLVKCTPEKLLFTVQ